MSVERPDPVAAGSGPVERANAAEKATALLTAEHEDRVLRPRGLTREVAKFGVRSVTSVDELPDELRGNRYAKAPGLLFPWQSPTGQVVWQFRPDAPVNNDDGEPVKYLFAAGTEPGLNRLREPSKANDGPLLLQEGTMQSLVAASYAPDGWAVYGMPGCWNWRNGDTKVPVEDLTVVDGRDVVVSLDADAGSNAHVYTAGMALKEALLAEGATSVKFLRLPGAGGTAGLDDVLGRRPAEKRRDYLRRLIVGATEKPADRRPRDRKKGPTSPFLSESSGLQVEALADALLDRHPAALDEERRVRIYRDGVFQRDGAALIGTLTELLGDAYRPAHRAAVEEFLVGRLWNEGRVLPAHIDRPLLNLRSGMLDLATGELLPHDPAYLSSVQFPVEWDPDATCPVYEGWMKGVIPDQAEALEEVAAQMLDPSQTPTKAAFLYGPSRSGKSTFLRLLQAVAGAENTSAVTLHQLANNRFMAANVYGKALNVASDMKAADVEDVSIFKMMTGNDPITADRKFGSQFTFRNRALFAFGANSLPAVAESSRAYSERVEPFRFGSSFAGREDPSIEAAMMTELPGILVRWVAAGQRRRERGRWQPTPAAVREEFEIGSDRVRQFVAACCTVHPTEVATLPEKQVTTLRHLHRQFMRWADEQRGGGMNQAKFGERLSTIAGVREVRTQEKKARGYNVTVERESRWGQEDDGPLVAEVANPTPLSSDAGPSSPVKITKGSVRSGSGEGRHGTATSATASSPACPSCGRVGQSGGRGSVTWMCRLHGPYRRPTEDGAA